MLFRKRRCSRWRNLGSIDVGVWWGSWSTLQLITMVRRKGYRLVVDKQRLDCAWPFLQPRIFDFQRWCVIRELMRLERSISHLQKSVAAAWIFHHTGFLHRHADEIIVMNEGLLVSAVPTRSRTTDLVRSTDSRDKRRIEWKRWRRIIKLPPYEKRREVLIGLVSTFDSIFDLFGDLLAGKILV